MEVILGCHRNWGLRRRVHSGSHTVAAKTWQLPPSHWWKGCRLQWWMSSCSFALLLQRLAAGLTHYPQLLDSNGSQYMSIDLSLLMTNYSSQEVTWACHLPIFYTIKTQFLSLGCTVPQSALAPLTPHTHSGPDSLQFDLFLLLTLPI